MPIRIIKKRKSAPPPDDKLAEGALTGDTVKESVPHKERTAKEMREAWQRIPPPGAKPKVCEFCEKAYLMPCDKERSEKCRNYLWKIGKREEISGQKP